MYPGKTAALRKGTKPAKPVNNAHTFTGGTWFTQPHPALTLHAVITGQRAGTTRTISCWFQGWKGKRWGGGRGQRARCFAVWPNFLHTPRPLITAFSYSSLVLLLFDRGLEGARWAFCFGSMNLVNVSKANTELLHTKGELLPCRLQSAAFPGNTFSCNPVQQMPLVRSAIFVQ